MRAHPGREAVEGRRRREFDRHGAWRPVAAADPLLRPSLRRAVLLGRDELEAVHLERSPPGLSEAACMRAIDHLRHPHLDRVAPRVHV